jgi:hypothetical protein
MASTLQGITREPVNNNNRANLVLTEIINFPLGRKSFMQKLFGLRRDELAPRPETWPVLPYSPGCKTVLNRPGANCVRFKLIKLNYLYWYQ